MGRGTGGGGGHSSDGCREIGGGNGQTTTTTTVEFLAAWRLSENRVDRENANTGLESGQLSNKAGTRYFVLRTPYSS